MKNNRFLVDFTPESDNFLPKSYQLVNISHSSENSLKIVVIYVKSARKPESGGEGVLVKFGDDRILKTPVPAIPP